jgi:ribosomal protein S17E
MKENTKDMLFKVFIAFLLVISAFLYFQFVIPYHLYFKEQIQLFLYSSDYFLSYFSKPGGLACLTGDFLTQFLYLRGGGAFTFAAILLVEWLLVTKILTLYGIKQLAPLWAVFPVIAEWIVCGNLSFSLAMSMSFIFTLVFFWIYASIKNQIISIISGILLIPILYFLTGAEMLLFPILALFYDICTGRRNFFYWLVIIVLASILPYFVRHHFLLTLKQAYFYPFLNYRNELSAIILSLIAFLCCFKFIRNQEIRIQSFSITIIFIFVLGIGGLILSTNMKREKTLEMATEAYFENWEKVLNLAEKKKLSNHIAGYYTNLALSKKAQLGDRILEFYQPFSSDLFLPVNPQSDWFTLFFSSDAYFYVGDMNMAQHAAMLGMIFSPYQRSSRLTRRLIEIYLVNNDIPAAMKYIRLLESTWVHKKQAVKLKEMLMAKDVKENPKNQAALDYRLCYQLLNKDISGFFETYSRYWKGNRDNIPKMYAEALLIYSATTKTKLKETDYPINEDYKNNFKEYSELYESTDGDQKTLQEKFPNTYWLYYHFTNLKP